MRVTFSQNDSSGNTAQEACFGDPWYLQSSSAVHSIGVAGVLVCADYDRCSWGTSQLM